MGLAADDPAAAAQALRLLELELAVLGDPQHNGALDPELRESRSLLDRLQLAVAGIPAADALAEATEVVRPQPPATPPAVTGPVPVPVRPDAPRRPAARTGPARTSCPCP